MWSDIYLVLVIVEACPCPRQAEALQVRPPRMQTSIQLGLKPDPPPENSHRRKAI